MLTWNILKLIVLSLFLWFISFMIAGKWWPLLMAGIMVAAWFWFKDEQDKEKRKAYLAQQVEVTRQNMIAAQAEADRAQQKADIADAIRQGIEAAQPKIPERIKGQWN